MTLQLTSTKEGNWIIKFGKYREVLWKTNKLSITRPEQRNDVLLINGFLIDGRRGRK